MKRQQLLKSIFTAFGFGFISHIVIPIVLLLVVDVLLSAMTIFDPLYAKKHLENIWTGFAVVLIFQLFYFIFASFGVGAGCAFLVDKIKSGWIYPAAMVLSLFLHYVLLFVFSIALYFAANNESFISYIVLYLFFIVVIAPLMGLICVAFVRRTRKS